MLASSRILDEGVVAPPGFRFNSFPVDAGIRSLAVAVPHKSHVDAELAAFAECHQISTELFLPEYVLLTEIQIRSGVKHPKMSQVLARSDVREAILDATDTLLSRYGYRKMTVEDVATEVGIGKGTIYLHFSSKEEVVLSHIDRIVDRVKDRLWAIVRSDGSATERLREMLLTRVMFRFDSIQHYTQSINELLAALRAGLLARRKRYFEDEAQIFAHVLNEGKQLGELAFDSTETVANSLLIATNGLLPYSLSTAELGERNDVEARAAAVADLLLHGLITRK